MLHGRANPPRAATFPGVLERLALIALGRGADFSLDEIALMFALDGRPRIDRRRLTAKAEELDMTIRELTAVPPMLLGGQEVDALTADDRRPTLGVRPELVAVTGTGLLAIDTSPNSKEPDGRIGKRSLYSFRLPVT